MIFFLIAAFNEERNISTLLEGINRYYTGNNDIRIIIVDDGSTDGTIQSVKNTVPAAKILIHKKNLGLGSALKTGFNRIFSEIKPGDFLITLDADNTHPVELSVEMLKTAKSADIVIASRYARAAKEIGLSKLRAFLSYSVNYLFRMIFPLPGTTDYTSGYRAFNGNFLLKIYDKYGENFITERGFTSTAEILIKTVQLKPVIKEVPLILRYDLKKGKSKMRIFRTIVDYLLLTFRHKFSI